MKPLNLKTIHPQWLPLVEQALTQVDSDYIDNLQKDPLWLPGPDKIFNAFSEPLDNLQFILFGESPYPREQSANGYAFWDNAVKEIWSEKGLSKPVNRATSLRNLIKMLLVTREDLQPTNVSQEAITKLDKSNYIQDVSDLFNNFSRNGFLLLNASLVLNQQTVSKNAKAWRPFMIELLRILAFKKPNIQLILLGNIAKQIDALEPTKAFTRFYAEHPYNISFINNEKVRKFFQPFDLLGRI